LLEVSSTAIKTTIYQIFIRFPRLIEKVEDIMNTFTEEHFSNTKYLAECILEMNLSHLYIDEQNFHFKSLLTKTIDMNPDYYEVNNNK